MECYYEAGVGVVVPKSIVPQVSEEEEDGDTNSRSKKRKKATKQNLKVINPSQQQLSSLLEYYQNGRFDDAEKLAVSVTQEFSKHQFAWKVLGAVLKQTGRITCRRLYSYHY